MRVLLSSIFSTMRGITMRYNFTNKTAIITGASSGIGKAIAFTLIKKYSCTVIAVARNEDRLYQAKEELGEFGERYIVRPFDASSKESWVKLAKDLKNTDTPIDILIPENIQYYSE